MAELAFEAVARLAITVVVFSLIVMLIYSLFSTSQSTVSLQGLVKMDMAQLPPEALGDVVEQCRRARVLNKDCAILLNVGEEDRAYLSSLGVAVLQNGSTALLSVSEGVVVLR